MENMTRRELLALAVGGGLGALWSPGSSVAWTQAADTWKRGYDAARTSNPYLLGFQNADRDRYASDLLPVYGRWPRDLAGTFYRNGPAGHEVGGRRYHHWFDGDGLVQAFHISADGIRHLGRFVETAKRRAERDADRMLWPAFGTSLDGGLPVSHPDTINTANISILHHAGELLALWEAGSPHRLDPQSLETLGIKTWRSDLRGAPFTAHPKVEPDGTVWAFGYALDRGLLVLYRIDAGGKVEKADTVGISPLGMIHDFAVTVNSLVFVIPPLVFDPERVAPGVSFLDTQVWRPELGTRVLAVDKDDFSCRRWWQLPPGFAYHLGNAWEDGGNVHFDYCVAPDATELTHTFREVMRGVWSPPTEPTRFAQVTLGTGDAVEQHVFDRQAEFPRVAPGVVAARHRYVYSLAGPLARRSDIASPGLDRVVRWDTETGDTDAYVYDADFIPEEHIFVPRPGSSTEAEGWVIGTALDLDRGITQLAAFDAIRIREGPVAVARLPYALPLGFHGIFVPA